MEEQQHPPVLRTVPQFSEKHPAFTQPSLRHLIFQSRPRESSLGTIPGNGLDRAIVRVGRKLMIDETRFFEWLEAQNAQPCKPATLAKIRPTPPATEHMARASGTQRAEPARPE